MQANKPPNMSDDDDFMQESDPEEYDFEVRSSWTDAALENLADMFLPRSSRTQTAAMMTATWT